MHFGSNQEINEHHTLDFSSIRSLEDSLLSIAYLAERTLSDLLILESKISEKLSSLETARRVLKVENEKLLIELRLSRESEEQAYEKLKLLREESRITSSVWTDSEAAAIVSHTSVCLAYPLACPLTARSWTSDSSHHQQLSNGTVTARSWTSDSSHHQQLSNGTVTFQRKNSGTEPLQSSRSSVFSDSLEQELYSLRICLANAQAREEELKHIADQSRRRDGYTCELISSNKDLKLLLASAQSELDKLWRREKSLCHEATAMTKTLSRREQEVSVLRQQVASISRLLSQRDDSIIMLETLLGEEQIRSKRNREIAAKVSGCIVCFRCAI
jgi:hypothetical protein